ncbi:mannitol dehydrogenase family protein [Vibrio panuliri]|uniref:Fructuronate reductase n=1 Tax=Vibrio panuliri TaxID=1381081 RepID=A0ABX3FLK1_9VIBR|nr:fructuronate reductase [Vibrio panuliri]KAB1458062.1 fructuronate reductase [Vibrio panuliri]OLQ95105.1 fructuronate reductase [Vibrio panuliri]
MKTIANHPLPSQVVQPTYSRDKLKSKIVHLGFGAFHRAHQALYTDQTNQVEGSDWGICEINLFGGEALINALRAQEHSFSVLLKGADGTQAHIVQAVTESLHPELDGLSAVLEKMAEPQVEIVSLTVTEKGYCIDAATGKLDIKNPLISADLENPHAPKTALGIIVQALKLRRERGLGAFTVMSCDNIQENGAVTKGAVLEYASLVAPEMREWIEATVTFPCTMVDRIVPAVTADTLDEITYILGCEDPCGIACEPFRQWVIEDNFVAGRPNWDSVGAEFVDDVVPYEEMKLRMLNGSHSFLAYLGYLAGYEHISDTMQDNAFKQAALDLMLKAQAPSLEMPQGTDLAAYANMLIDRYSNPNLKHRTWQIAMDGSQKIPQRLGGSLRFHLQQGSDFKWLATAIAGWMRYVSGIDEQGNAIEVSDPMSVKLRAICDAHGFNASLVPELLALESIFPADIGQDKRVIAAVSKAYQSLLDKGARQTVVELVTE